MHQSSIIRFEILEHSLPRIWHSSWLDYTHTLSSSYSDFFLFNHHQTFWMNYNVILVPVSYCIRILACVWFHNVPRACFQYLFIFINTTWAYKPYRIVEGKKTNYSYQKWLWCHHLGSKILWNLNYIRLCILCILFCCVVLVRWFRCLSCSIFFFYQLFWSNDQKPVVYLVVSLLFSCSTQVI